MNSLHFFIQQEVNRFESACRSKRQQVLHCDDVFEIARIVTSSNPPSTVSFMRHQMPERQHLFKEAEQRAKALVQEMADGKRELPHQGLYSLYRACAGRFPEAARLVDRMMRLQHESESQARRSTEASGPQP